MHFRRRAPVAILGIPFDDIRFDEVIQVVQEMVESGTPHCLVTANVDFLVQALQDFELRRILLDADLVLCDGTPLLWASRLLKNPLRERVAGADLVPALLAAAEARSYRVFFLGADPASAAEAVRRTRRLHPLLQLDAYSPPFAPLLEMDHETILERVRAFRPDILLVAFGCPKQEKWIAMHYRTLGVPVSIGVGATIDFLAGRFRRAPRWMQRTGTEWLFRLAQEPRRLMRRYGSDLWHFSRMIGAQWLEFTWGRKRGPRLALSSISSEDKWHRIQVPEVFDCHIARRDCGLMHEALEQEAHCLLDLSRVQSIDSTGVGALVRLDRALRARRRLLVILKPSPPVLRALALLQLSHFFHVAATEQDAHKFGLPEAPVESEPARHIRWIGEVTAANADQVWKLTQSQILVQGAISRRIAIDLALVRFIDSSGLTVMLRSRRFAEEQGFSLSFLNLQPMVRNVLRLAKMEQFLLQPTP